MGMNFKNFVSNSKSMLIAPAGFGKTHCIGQCLTYLSGKQLILTHTHAGVASIKEKLKKLNIKSDLFQVETITSLAQKYVLSFDTSGMIPEQGSSEYYRYIVLKFIELLEFSQISNIIKISYEGLFVDEYQDCTTDQHELILTLAKFLPTRILGDPLQGIFGFGGDILVNMDNDLDMQDFSSSRFELKEPKRWEDSNPLLGIDLKEIREKIKNKSSFNLQNYKSIETHCFPENDKYKSRTAYNQLIWKLGSEKSILIIHPISVGVTPRLKLLEKFPNLYFLVEAIDDKDFYEISELLDKCDHNSILKTIIKVSFKLFSKTPLHYWFNTDTFKLKKKQNEHDKQIAKVLQDTFNSYVVNPSKKNMMKIFVQISELPKMITYRKELLRSMLNALVIASDNELTVLESMKQIRNKTRIVGRSVQGRCIGTTLLTKGLEFDTVLLLDADKMESPKHLYVAFTRAKKRLIVVAKSSIIQPKY